MFLYGVHRHCEGTRDPALARSLAPRLRRSADWIVGNLAASGFGPADFSIWEESERGLAHHTYTQAWYVAGLHAAQWLAEGRHDPAASDWYAGGPAAITTALQRPSTGGPAGLWDTEGHYDRAVRLDGSAHRQLDSSTNILFALGVVDHASQRATSHVAAVVDGLTRDRHGIARYRGDDYYHTSRFSPAGDEAGAPDPSWPQMSMWVAVHETLSGRRDEALARMKWFVGTLGRGYMPHGEVVSPVTGRPVLSSMSAPLTAASFLLAALLHQGRHDLRIVPPIHNAGAFKAVAVAEGAPGDARAWSDVPYFLAPRREEPCGWPVTSIKRVYLANDADNLYLRVDNEAGWLPASGGNLRFALRVYSADLAGGRTPVTLLALSGPALSRPASFLVERRSDSGDLCRHQVRKGRWHQDGLVATDVAPRWDPATGRVVAVIPILALASAAPAPGSAWAAIHVELSRYDPVSGAWIGDGRVSLHYRVSSREQPWIYGHVDR